MRLASRASTTQQRRRRRASWRLAEERNYQKLRRLAVSLISVARIFACRSLIKAAQREQTIDLLTHRAPYRCDCARTQSAELTGCACASIQFTLRKSRAKLKFGFCRTNFNVRAYIDGNPNDIDETKTNRIKQMIRKIKVIQPFAVRQSASTKQIDEWLSL